VRIIAQLESIYRGLASRSTSSQIYSQISVNLVDILILIEDVGSF